MLKGKNIPDSRLTKEEKINILERNIELLKDSNESAYCAKMKAQLAELKAN